MLAMLADCEAEESFMHSDAYALLAEADESASKADCTIPLERVNRASPRDILRNVNLEDDLRSRFLCFLGRCKRSPWMRGQKFFRERIGISLLSQTWGYGKRMAMCGVNGHFCQMPDHCIQCADMLRYKPAVYEYGHAYERAPNWNTATVSFRRNPDHAGLHFVVEKGDRKTGKKAKVLRFNPYKGMPRPGNLTVQQGEADGVENPVVACHNAAFEFGNRYVKALKSVGLHVGALGSRELAWHYLPHHMTPNTHYLLDTSDPIEFEQAKEMLHLLERCYAVQPCDRRLYPDLHIEPLESQAAINRWLYYMFKPMDYVKGYVRLANGGADIAKLNADLDEHLFQNAEVILSVRSPRRFGNLFCKSPGYIGAGSITEWRKAQKDARKAQKQRREQKKESNVEKVLRDEALRRNEEVRGDVGGSVENE